MFIVALLLSSVAAYYSIAGLVAIFSAAVLPIIIMGGSLEVAKLVVASWLYRNWKEVPLMMKSYFTIALVVLMCLTSMGIFGFLSKAHLDQAVPSGDVAAKVALIDEKIKTEKETINEARKTIVQLDSQVNQTIARTANDTTDSGIRRSIGVRKSQAKERRDLYSAIETSQKTISQLNEERAPIASQLRKVEAEVGPIKYIAALIYGDNPDSNVLEKAVRWVIIMIVSVFDPLAVLMLIAANWSLKHVRKEEKDRDMSYYSDSKWTEEELKEAEIENQDEEVWEDLFTEDPEPEIKQSYLEKEWVPIPHGDPVVAPKHYTMNVELPDVPIDPTKTIAEEVELLQKPMVSVNEFDQYDSEYNSAGKKVEYDSVGRRITPE